jgi:hypothetical protein
LNQPKALEGVGKIVIFASHHSHCGSSGAGCGRIREEFILLLIAAETARAGRRSAIVAGGGVTSAAAAGYADCGNSRQFPVRRKQFPVSGKEFPISRPG